MKTVGDIREYQARETPGQSESVPAQKKTSRKNTTCIAPNCKFGYKHANHALKNHWFRCAETQNFPRDVSLPFAVLKKMFQPY